MWFNLLDPSISPTYQGQSIFDNVTPNISSFKFVRVFGWALSWVLRKQTKWVRVVSAFRACSGSTHQQGGVMAELGHWGPQSTAPVCGLIIFVFCLLQLLIHWVNQEPCSSASPPWFGSRKGKAWCNYVRRVVRFCFYPWCFPGQWGNSLINSVAGLGDPRPLSHSCYSLSHSCYSKVKRYEAFQGISLMNLQK